MHKKSNPKVALLAGGGAGLDLHCLVCLWLKPARLFSIANKPGSNQPLKQKSNPKVALGGSSLDWSALALLARPCRFISLRSIQTSCAASHLSYPATKKATLRLL